MLCPKCRSGRCRRSRRRSWNDYAISLFGLRPWRCRLCQVRFFAWSVAFPFLRFVHCHRCGNLDVQRISSHHVEGFGTSLFRMAHVPAYRCGPCRHRFFSILSHHRIRPVDLEIPDIEDSKETATLASGG